MKGSSNKQILEAELPVAKKLRAHIKKFIMIINIPIEVKDRELYLKLLICYHLLKRKKK